jgi:serine/threonine protein kinase
MKRFCHHCNHTFDDDADITCPECQSPRPDSEWPVDRRLGQTVVGGQYRVLRRLGAGGFGVVYLVETVVGGLRRALKVLHTEWLASPDMRERFINEAVVLEQVNHPNVARCYAVGTLEDDAALYMLLELVTGVPLSGVLRGEEGATHALNPARAVRIAKQVASGLVVAHANDVLHRDLKPENILIMDPGNPGEQAKLIDFGIAKSMADRTAPVTREVLGTPAYMAPEQISSTQPLDRRVDLWQLGATLYLMLTGEVPYREQGGGVAELQRLHAARLDAGPRPSEVNPALAAHPPWPLIRRSTASSAVCWRPHRSADHAERHRSVKSSPGSSTRYCPKRPSRGRWACWRRCAPRRAKQPGGP